MSETKYKHIGEMYYNLLDTCKWNQHLFVVLNNQSNGSEGGKNTRWVCGLHIFYTQYLLINATRGAEGNCHSTHTHTHTYIYIYLCTCTHAYIYTHTYTYMCNNTYIFKEKYHFFHVFTAMICGSYTYFFTADYKILDIRYCFNNFENSN